MHPNCRRGSLPKMRGSRLSGSALLYLYSNICATHRQDCCALFAYETALCDRKDTQSRFAVNAARSIVCVGTPDNKEVFLMKRRFQCRTQHCVCWDKKPYDHTKDFSLFQCRTQHCVCRDKLYDGGRVAKVPVSMPHAALCVSRRCVPQPLCGAGCTVLERRNGGMRLCARAGALSISFSSYLKIAHASFFFNDVFCVDAERSVKNILYLSKFYFICIIVLV